MLDIRMKIWDENLGFLIYDLALRKNEYPHLTNRQMRVFVTSRISQAAY